MDPVVYVDLESSVSDDSPEVLFVSSTPTVGNRSSENSNDSSSSKMPYEAINRCLYEIQSAAQQQTARILELEKALGEKMALEKQLEEYKERYKNLEAELRLLKVCHEAIGSLPASSHADPGNEIIVKSTLRKYLEVFTCCICNELFIEPAVTNCNHIFCSKCINTWRSSNDDCPICRVDIAYVNIVREIDEFITSVLSASSDKLYAERLQEIEDRDHVQEITRPGPKKRKR